MSHQISIRYRLKIVFLFCLLFAIGYGFTNRFPVFTPRLLPATFIDDWMGFHPWTAWIYISDYVLIFLPAILMTDMGSLKRLLKAFFVNFVIHFPLFFLFPTTMTRPALDNDNLTNTVFNLVRMMDTPVNCFPSQHVSLCFVVAMGFWNYKRRLSEAMFIWATLISLSTLTTKQHYFWDVLGGLMVAWIVYMIVYRKKVQPHITLVSPNK